MKDLESAIYEQRVLVFMETDAQSGKYNQVLLSPEKFKKLSGVISVISKDQTNLKDGIERVVTELSEEEYKLPDLQSIYHE